MIRVSNCKQWAFAAALATLSAHAGPVKAAKKLWKNTVVAVVHLNEVMKSEAIRTHETAFAILDAEGNLVKVILTGPSAQSVYNAAKNATLGQARGATTYVFDTSKDAITLSGDSVSWAAGSSLSFVKDLTDKIPGAQYTIAPLTKGLASLTSNLVKGITGSANVVLDFSGKIANDSYNMLEGILDGSVKCACVIGKGLLWNLPKQFFQDLGKL